MKKRWLCVLLLVLLGLRERFRLFIIFLYLWNNKLKKQAGTWQDQVFKKSGYKNFPIFQEFETWNHDIADVEINNSLFICFTFNTWKASYLKCSLEKRCPNSESINYYNHFATTAMPVTKLWRKREKLCSLSCLE